MDIIPPEKEARLAQSDDIEKGPANRRAAQSNSVQHQETQRSKGKGGKSVRDYKYSDVKPIMLKNRERGQKTKGTAIHKYLQRKYDGSFEGQLRSTQRMVRKLHKELDDEHRQRIKRPDEPFPEIYFRQEYHPGEDAQLDCSSLTSLGITIKGEPFRGKIFTFKLMYSKWIYARIVSGETDIEVLAAIEDALWTLQGVPQRLRSDNGKALFRKAKVPTEAYNELCSHYGTPCSSINPGHPNENGGAETANKTVKGLLGDRLTTDTDPEFPSEDELTTLLREVIDEYNGGVQPELNEERRHLGSLPTQRVEPYEQFQRKVSKEGLIKYAGREYSVPPELHQTRAKIRRYADYLVIYNNAGEPVWRWPLALDTAGRVDFQHVIHWLRRKPGAFKDYAYKDQLFPTERFRRAYLKLEQLYAPEHAVKNYLAILTIAAGSHPIRQDDDYLIGEVDCALELLLAGKTKFTDSDVRNLVEMTAEPRSHRQASMISQMRLLPQRIACDPEPTID